MDGYPSSYFKTNNRGVKDLTLNIKDPRGKEIFYKLVAQADVFSQNFRSGAAGKNGFGYEVLKKVKPKALCLNLGIWPGWPPCAAAGNGPRMGQALSGVAEAYSSPGQPLHTGIVSVADESCAILTFGGILAAVISAQKPAEVKRSKPLCWVRRCE